MAGDCSPSPNVVSKISTRSLIELSAIGSIFADVRGFGKLIIRDYLISKHYEHDPSYLAARLCGRCTREFRKITVDYLIEFARVLRASSPGAAFSFLSGGGADQTERSRIAFARYKGAAEKALLAAGFRRLYIFRPALSIPWNPGRNRTSATGCCAPSTLCFGRCSPIR
jgi:hypothetical protein